MAAATPDCDYGVTVDLEIGCGGSGGDGSAAASASGVQNRGSTAAAEAAASGPAPSTASFTLLYYLFFMFYMTGFSKTWWHAALGIAVATAFLVVSCCVDFSTSRHDSTRQCLTLVLYYFFFMFYLVGSSEYWWHAALGIVLVTGFVLLSFFLFVARPLQPPEGDDVKPPDRDGSDLSTTLLGSTVEIN